MNILGLNVFHADTSACLIKNGKIIAATEEERFTRIKHFSGFPKNSIDFCIKEGNLQLSDIDYISVNYNKYYNLKEKINFSLSNIFSSNIFGKSILSFKKNNLNDMFIKTFGLNFEKKIFYVPHHLSHILSTFYYFGIKDGIGISIDGSGDFSTTEIYDLKENISLIEKVNYPHSLGIFYQSMTQFLGFKNYGDEYKVMGLAPYGKPKYLNQMKQIINIDSHGRFKLNKNYFKHFNNGVEMEWNNGIPRISKLYTKNWIDLFGLSRSKNEKIEQKHKDLAASAQKLTEIIIFHILNNLYKQTGCDNICITGGVAQNSVVNGKVLQNTKFKKIYIPSAGHDAGTAIGAALYLYNQILNKERIPEITSSYFGSRFSNNHVIEIINKYALQYSSHKDDELFEIVTNKIISGGVIGWFQGRAEFGPRALGHRSILVDPRRKDAKKLLNDKIKKREHFRPFAPSILKEYVSEYFEQDDQVYFMEKVFKIRKEKRKEIPAVTHVDGTGRLQTVSMETCSKFYKLISVFNDKTGVPILLNTSFNENEPIVNSPQEAIDCFLRTNMDMLVMENIIIQR